MLRLLDVIVIHAAGLIAFLFRDYWDALAPLHKGYDYYGMVALASLLFILSGGDLYRSWREASMMGILRGVSSRWVSIASLLLIVLYTFKASEGISRIWFFLWLMLGLVFLWLGRIGFYVAIKELHRIAGNARKVVLIGSGGLADRIIDQVTQTEWSGYELVEHMSDLNFDAIRSYEDKQIDEIWLAIPFADEATMRHVMTELRYFPSSIRYIPDLFALGLINHGLSEILGMPMVDLTASRLDGLSKLLKTIEDYVVAMIALIVTFPLMLLIVLLIKLESRGPILFKQRRHGLSGKIIDVYKFRSMKHEKSETSLVVQAQKNDSRVTQVGKLLRRTSLDELPQLINVIKGEMSIVGPRPHAVEHNHQYKSLIESYMKRHIVKPGITGWAQINGFRGETDTIEKMEGRIQCDIFYIENWSITLDIKIMFLTLIKGMIGKNAY